MTGMEEAACASLIAMPVRRFKTSDLSRILELETEAFPKTPFSRRTFLQFAEMRQSRFLVYEDEGGVSGYVIFSFQRLPRSVYVASVPVEERHRKKGTGRALMDKAIEAAEHAGAHEMTLHVRASNRAAIDPSTTGLSSPWSIPAGG